MGDQEGTLRFQGPTPLDGGFELYEAVDRSSPDPRERLYSAVVLYQDGVADGCPALGGTRFLPESDDSVVSRVVHQLSTAMVLKTTVIRKAAERCLNGSAQHLKWTGGKSAIFAYRDPARPRDDDRLLLERRLEAHARLVNYVGGRYIASLDQGIGHAELEVIARHTPHTVGLGCEVDTGEATAHGVVAAQQQAVREMGMGDTLEGKRILVFGIGKVGLPLVQLLDDAGATVFVFDPRLQPHQESAEQAFAAAAARGAAVNAELHLRTLLRLTNQRRVFRSETEALQAHDMDIVSPNGGGTGWLWEAPDGDSRSRAMILASARKAGSRVALIVGAGNDQVPILPGEREQRDEVLRALAGAGIAFVPDPLVSGGGVVAVSHERLPEWRRERVNDEARQIAREGVSQVFEASRGSGGTDAERMYDAFEGLLYREWPPLEKLRDGP